MGSLGIRIWWFLNIFLRNLCHLWRSLKSVTQDEEVHHVVHVMVLDAEVLSGQLIGRRVHDGQLEAAQARRPNFVLHPDDLWSQPFMPGSECNFQSLLSDWHPFGGSGSVSIATKGDADLEFFPENFNLLSIIFEIMIPMTLARKIKQFKLALL